MFAYRELSPRTVEAVAAAHDSARLLDEAGLIGRATQSLSVRERD